MNRIAARARAAAPRADRVRTMRAMAIKWQMLVAAAAVMMLNLCRPSGAASVTVEQKPHIVYFLVDDL